MQPFLERLSLVAVLTLLPGCGSCAGEPSPSGGPAPAGSIGPKGQRFMSTSLPNDDPAPLPFARDASARDAH